MSAQKNIQKKGEKVAVEMTMKYLKNTLWKNVKLWQGESHSFAWISKNGIIVTSKGTQVGI